MFLWRCAFALERSYIPEFLRGGFSKLSQVASHTQISRLCISDITLRGTRIAKGTTLHKMFSRQASYHANTLASNANLNRAQSLRIFEKSQNTNVRAPAYEDSHEMTIPQVMRWPEPNSNSVNIVIFKIIFIRQKASFEGTTCEHNRKDTFSKVMLLC